MTRSMQRLSRTTDHADRRSKIYGGQPRPDRSRIAASAGHSAAAATTYPQLCQRRERCDHLGEDLKRSGVKTAKHHHAGKAGKFSELLKCGRWIADDRDDPDRNRRKPLELPPRMSVRCSASQRSSAVETQGRSSTRPDANTSNTSTPSWEEPGRRRVRRKTPEPPRALVLPAPIPTSTPPPVTPTSLAPTAPIRPLTPPAPDSRGDVEDYNWDLAAIQMARP